MNIILIIFYVVLPIMCNGVKHTKPKLCINCKHFIPDNGTGKYGTCSLFPKKQGQIDFLVNGVNENSYYYCSISREMGNMCGEEGKYYKKNRYKKNHIK